MPTKGKGSRTPRSSGQEESNWTDDLPVCKQTGVGFSTNQVYKGDGQRAEDHPYEERCFYFQPSEQVCLYGVFDGHDGVQAAAFAHQRLAAELLLGQLAGKSTDEEIREVLRQAFNAVEKSYLESLDEKVAERTSLLDEVPPNMNSYELYQQYPDVVDKLDRLNGELSCGSSAVVGLIVDGTRLFVANVGDARALLTRTGQDGVLRVQQISVDHDLSNEDEVLRLHTLGLKIDDPLQNLCNEGNTRCFGNFLVKGAYKELEDLAAASEEPIIADPEISSPIHLDESCRFLLLMSDGLYRTFEEATGTNQVNKEIASMAAAEFKTQSTVTGVAQAVVDRVVRKHHDHFMMSGSTGVRRRDDITLLVRAFNQSLNVPPTPGLETESSAMTQSEDTSTTSTNTESGGSEQPVLSYVDFKEFYHNVEQATRQATLPPILQNLSIP